MNPKNLIGPNPQEYIGKRLLVGITYETKSGEFIRQEQFHGLISEVTAEKIIIDRADTGRPYSLPPELIKANPGNYRLRSTGETVENPDYLATWLMVEKGTEVANSDGD